MSESDLQKATRRNAIFLAIAVVFLLLTIAYAVRTIVHTENSAQTIQENADRAMRLEKTLAAMNDRFDKAYAHQRENRELIEHMSAEVQELRATVAAAEVARAARERREIKRYKAEIAAEASTKAVLKSHDTWIKDHQP